MKNHELPRRQHDLLGTPPRPPVMLLSLMVLMGLVHELVSGIARGAPWTLLAPLVFALSVVWNFGIPVAYLSWRRHDDPMAFDGLRPVTAYASGVLGDCVVVPLFNVAMLSFLRALPFDEAPQLAFVAVALGASVTAALHAGQAHFRLVNWAMPLPGRWNFAGQWHLISAPVQFAMVFYGFGAALLAGPAIRLGDADALAWMSGLALLFVATAVIDYRAELTAGGRWVQEAVALRLLRESIDGR